MTPEREAQKFRLAHQMLTKLMGKTNLKLFIGITGTIYNQSSAIGLFFQILLHQACLFFGECQDSKPCHLLL